MTVPVPGTQQSVLPAVTSVTFRVSDVWCATCPLGEHPTREALGNLLRVVPAGMRDEMRSLVKDKEDAKALLAARPVEAASHWYGQLVRAGSIHPFVGAAQLAFARHHPLVLSPDMVWLVLLQGIAAHVAGRHEQLRGQLVRHQGREVLTVLRPDFHKGSPDNDWEGVLEEFSQHIRDHIGPELHNQFLPRFSTTDAVSRLAAGVLLMNVLEPYFEYEVRSICGIPRITLEGTPEDWRTLARGIENFRRLGLDWWIDVLAPVLAEFVVAAEGRARPEFWRSLYHESSRCGSEVTGWILAFFPYLDTGGTGRADVRNRWITAPGWNQSAESGAVGSWPGRVSDGVDPGVFPAGMARVPFKWRVGWFGPLTRAYDMELLGGFIGVRQVGEDFALRPEIGWAVRDAG